MKTLISVLTLLLAGGYCKGEEESRFEDVLEAIAIVESNANDRAVGDGGKAFGRFQIWAAYVKDVNRIAGTSFSHSDAYNPEKAAYMVSIYLTHYGRVYERKTGNRPSSEVLCRIHNGGPNGWRKPATVWYWLKCKKVLSDVEEKKTAAGNLVAAR